MAYMYKVRRQQLMVWRNRLQPGSKTSKLIAPNSHLNQIHKGRTLCSSEDWRSVKHVLFLPRKAGDLD